MSPDISKPATILIVDDEPCILTTLTMLLELEGLRVQIANDGLEALERLRLEEPELIITDYMMPRMDGISLVMELRSTQNFMSVPILVTSAVDLANHELFALPRVFFLRKPTPWSSLKELIFSLLNPSDS